jgi:hypothetical protein
MKRDAWPARHSRITFIRSPTSQGTERHMTRAMRYALCATACVLMIASPATADVNLPEEEQAALQQAVLQSAGFQAADLMFEGTVMMPDDEPVTPEPEVRACIKKPPEAFPPEAFIPPPHTYTHGFTAYHHPVATPGGSSTPR